MTEKINKMGGSCCHREIIRCKSNEVVSIGIQSGGSHVMIQLEADYFLETETKNFMINELRLPLVNISTASFIQLKKILSNQFLIADTLIIHIQM